MNASHQRNSNHFILVWLVVIVASLWALPLAAQQNEKDGAKSIFYNPSTGAASKPNQKTKAGKAQGDKILVNRTRIAPAKNPGIHYWFEMDGVGKVTDDRVFYTGDRIRLHLRSNIDGYLTLWAYDSSGHSQLLFPSPTQSGDGKALGFSGNSNFVQANYEYTVPGTIEFRPPAEDERLLIFFSELKDDVPFSKNASLTAGQINKATQSDGGKALVFEVEKKDQATLGSYIANRQGGSIAKEIRLKHLAGK